jgi:hypothetical protein
MKRWLDRDIKSFVQRIRNAAVTIQAAVRGHLVRHKSPYLNCCMCLAHTICPLESQVGMICRACGAQGPYEDITGPVTDPWNWARSDLVDWTRQGQCHCDECQVEEMERCNGCGKVEEAGSMDSSPGYGFYCSRACGPSGYAKDYGWGCD